MKILTETMLRAATLADSTTEYRVEPDVFVTPLAKEYLRDRGISLVIMERQPAVMTRTPLPGHGQRTYIDAQTGAGYGEKPEHMTHLRGNLLVPKTHPRIAFRGQLDSLQGRDHLPSGRSLRQETGKAGDRPGRYSLWRPVYSGRRGEGRTPGADEDSRHDR